MVFEDLHWIDTETQALLDSLVESLPTARLLLLVTYRPEYQHGWGGKTTTPSSASTRCRWRAPTSCCRPCSGTIPASPRSRRSSSSGPRAIRSFWKRACGRWWRPACWSAGPGAYRLAQAAPTIQVPATVQAVLAARIDRLPPEEKRLLQTAAVIGTEVPLSLLQAIAELPEDALRRGLAHLQTAEFLYERSLFPELEYIFKHALTHEVAYSNLLQERRRVLHARIIDAIETIVCRPPSRAGGAVGPSRPAGRDVGQGPGVLLAGGPAGQRALGICGSRGPSDDRARGAEEVAGDIPSGTNMSLDLQITLGHALRCHQGICRS